LVVHQTFLHLIGPSQAKKSMIDRNIYYLLWTVTSQSAQEEKIALFRMAEQIANVPSGESRVILATGRYLGEGFDDERLDTLFLALPISWRGTLTQYTGRLHRLNATKKEVQLALVDL
jgi:superfamily II DNA or RNA helicase